MIGRSPIVFNYKESESWKVEVDSGRNWLFELKKRHPNWNFFLRTSRSGIAVEHNFFKKIQFKNFYIIAGSEQWAAVAGKMTSGLRF